MTTQEFISKYRSDDVRKLAFEACRYPEVDAPFALNQIAGWQTALAKLPSWARCDDIVYPPHISMEQCSSEKTALYKASLADGTTMVDLTGGFGVDFSFFAHRFREATYVEKQAHLCDIAQHNFHSLGLGNTSVVCGDSVEYLRQMSPVDLIYLDPARRDVHGAKTYAMEDCTPDVLQLKDLLLEKADTVIVKLSPMLDWHLAVQKLGDVASVHIVSVENECKELLLVMKKIPMKPLIFCVNDGSVVTFEADDRVLPVFAENDWVDRLLCVPNASIMKSGLFGNLCSQFCVKSIGQNSNLLVADESLQADAFPGRVFRIQAVTTLNKSSLRVALAGIDRANIAVRNFPLNVQELRKRLKLKDGGAIYLFATTLASSQHVLFVCRKLR